MTNKYIMCFEMTNKEVGDVERNVQIIKDLDGKKIVVINDVLFKGKRKMDWKEVKQFVGNYELEEGLEILAIKKKRVAHNKMCDVNPFL